MNWTNVKLIFCREVRDQLRDRRTLFMIAVLPLVLYPLLGMSFLQISQFFRDHATKVLLIGAPDVACLPPLVSDKRFAAELFPNPDRVNSIEVETQSDRLQDPERAKAEARELAQSGKYDVVVYFPPEFGAQLSNFRAHLLDRQQGKATTNAKVPDPIKFTNESKERAKIALARVSQVLDSWSEAVGRQNLDLSQVPSTAARPFQFATDDVAEGSEHQAALWSKILPFVLLLWALTGAFYPAVDLCAGEKERGTLETLLSSPAERIEIVWGKLLTIMLFSIATAVLNLISMGLTGSFVFSQMQSFGAPPMLAVLWLLLALLPVSALYSGLCLALAAFARSTKEGQYYLMPLVLVTLPLTILPMSPGVELTLGNSLIPITGVVLLLRTLLEGNYMQALPFVAPVLGVTLGCCLLAVRWAADQFNTESVLFRESERFDLGLWLTHLMRDRSDTPTVPLAVACGVLILMIEFFMNFALARPGQSMDLARLTAITQLVVIATPALLMTVMLTRSPRKTLLLNLPHWGAIPAAVLLAICIHPLASVLQYLVLRLYPLSEAMQEHASKLKTGMQSPSTILLLAIVPAICEELAFRGFILSGLRHMGHKWRAIIVSSIFFGLAHNIFQQSLVTCLLGTLIAYLAVQTGSIFPGMLFHILHNSMQLLTSKITPRLIEGVPFLEWLINPKALDENSTAFSDQFLYRWPVMLAGGIGAAVIIYWLHKLPYARSSEESLQEEIEASDTPGVELHRASAGAGS